MTKRQTVLAAAAQLAIAKDSSEKRGGDAGSQSNTALSVLTERQTLLSEIAGGRRRDAAHRLVEPEQCRMWRRHNRLYERLDERNCGDLIHGIGEEGQKFPAIVRKLKDDPEGYEYEVICGARRHFAVSYLRNVRNRTDILYLIEVRTLTDEEAFQLSDVENRERRDISDYERGLDYDSALAEFYDGNASAMAAKLGLARQTLNNYLYLARLPEPIIKAFADPLEIAVRHSAYLTPLVGDPAKKQRVLARAEEIAKEQENAISVGNAPAYDGATVFKMLREAGALKKPKPKSRNEKYVVRTKTGADMLQVEKTPKFVTLRIPRSSLQQKKELIDAIRKEIG